MRIRHKVPSIFSLSMVDMLCCALGCVILVWLLNAKQAEDDAEERAAEIALNQRLLDEAKRSHADAAAMVEKLLADRDTARKAAAGLQGKLSDLETRLALLLEQLTAEQATAKDLAGKLKQSGTRVAMLEADAKTSKAQLDEERKRIDALEKLGGQKDVTLKEARADLAAREASLKALQEKLLAALEKFREERERADKLQKGIASTQMERTRAEALVKDARSEKEKLEAALKDRDKDLLAAKDREADLRGLLRVRLDEVAATMLKLKTLEKDRRELQATIEARFAGIELTGERVIFLVDQSGSMEMTDEKTDAPEKWAEVRKTVLKLMASLPRLQKYQLILFNDAVTYPLGGDGKWLDFDSKALEQVEKVMKGTKPRAGTNMSIAMSQAFKYRPLGLDTIYLLSDGLPNQGEGLTPAEAKSLKGVDRGVALGRHVRTMLKRTWNKDELETKRVKIHTVGFFYESPDLGSFLWALARENDGSFVGMSKP